MNLIKTLTLLALGLGLGCSPFTVQAEDKVLRLYNWADYFAPDTLAAFTRETGIQVIYDVMDSSETLEAKMMSGHSGYDLIFPGDTVAERLMRAGALQKLDPGKLERLDDLEPGLRALQARYPHSRHATVPYTWGTIGLTWNQAMIDSPDEVLAVVLHYLGREPRSAKREDLAAASALLSAIRPYVRKFQSQPVTELVNENLCLSLGYSGDVIQAQRTAEAAGKAIDFQYRVPREGTTVWMDTMAIPADARHPEYAYRFINFVMRPENMAEISNFTGYPTASAKARSQVDARLRDNPDIYLSDATFTRLIPGKDIPQADMRARMRVWTRFKTAQD